MTMFSEQDCTGESESEMMRFRPNSREICHEVKEEDEEDDFPYESLKCSNNHLYK